MPAKWHKMCTPPISVAVSPTACSISACLVTSTHLTFTIALGKSAARAEIWEADWPGLMSKMQRPERPCSKRPRHAGRARLPAPPVTGGFGQVSTWRSEVNAFAIDGPYTTGSGMQHYVVESDIPMALPSIANRFAALSAAEMVDGNGAGGAVRRLSLLERLMTGSFRFTSSSRDRDIVRTMKQ